jgi:hypothetical protein
MSFLNPKMFPYPPKIVSFIPRIISVFVKQTKMKSELNKYLDAIDVKKNYLRQEILKFEEENFIQ